MYRKRLWIGCFFLSSFIFITLITAYAFRITGEFQTEGRFGVSHPSDTVRMTSWKRVCGR